jgi:DNA replication protein DnaC
MNETTLSQLSRMKLYGMQHAFESLLSNHQHQSLTHDELISMLVQAEWEARENKSLSRRVKSARFRYQASMDEIVFLPTRNLDKTQVLRFSECRFMEQAENIIITGPTGVGKSFLVSAIGHQACSQGYKVLYTNSQKLFPMLKMAKADDSYKKELKRIERSDLFILDDFGLQQMDTHNRLSLLEIIEDRYKQKSMIISSQLPLDKWYDIIGESTIADAILDRIAHDAHKIEIKGESMRKKK